METEIKTIDITDYRNRISEDFENLRNVAAGHEVDFESKRLMIGVASAAVYARELGVNFEISSLLSRIRSCDGRLNHNSLADLGLIEAACDPNSDFLSYFEERKSSTATEIRSSSADYGSFFKAAYASQISDRPFNISQDKKEEILQIGKASLERIASLESVDEYSIHQLKPILTSYLVLSKECDFKVPKEVIDKLYSQICEFEKKDSPRQYHTRNNIFAEKIMLLSLYEK